MSRSGDGSDDTKRPALRSVRTASDSERTDESERPAQSRRRAPEDAADRLLLELLADLTLSRNEIARRAGVGMATVSRHAAKVGRTFDRGRTAVAVASRVVDVRARRAELMGLLIEDAHRERLLRDELSAKALDPARARASLSQSIGATVRAAVELESAEFQRMRLEADERAAAGVDDYLSHLSGERVG
jgi:hypothetical protein